MPKYSYRLKNGKTLELEGDVQPSDFEVESIAKQQGVELEPQDVGEVKGNTFMDSISQYIPSPNTMRSGAAMGVRGLSGLVPGGPWGAAAGGIGELIAQTIEPRESYNLWQVPVQAGIGFIPFGKAATVGKGLAKGAAMGAGGSIATNLAETGELPSAGNLALSTGLGAVGGGISGKLGSKVAAKEVSVFAKEAEKIAPKLDLQSLEAKPLIESSSKNVPKPKISAAQAAFNLRNQSQLLPKPISKEAEPILLKIKEKEPEKAGPIREAWNLSRGLMAVDLPFITSAGFRQGLPLIGTRNWFKAWVPSVKAFGSKAASEAHEAILKSDSLMERRVIPVYGKDGTPVISKGRPVYKELPSIAEEAGIHFVDLKSFTGREESIRSQLSERIPLWGRYVAASNRSYAAYLNDLRLNTFRNFYEAMPDKNNIVALKELGDAVNTFTGRGPLKTKIPFTGGKELNVERYSKGLAEVLFAPKLIASRMQMLNPVNYTMATPQVRKQYLYAALRTAGAWTTLAGLAHMTGVGETTLNPTSADFGKIRIGDVRLDPAGGFQQFLVLASRLASNQWTSSVPPIYMQKPEELGTVFGGQTRGSLTQDFVSNKLHPSLKYFYDAAFARKYQPFPVFDRAVQLVMPMITQDLTEIYQEHPELVPGLAILGSAGMGTQFYTQERLNKPSFIPEEWDITLGRR